MGTDLTAGWCTDTGRDELRASRVHALLATIERIADSESRTENVRRLLLPVLISAVLVVTLVVTATVFMGPTWILGAIGTVTTVAGVSGYLRRVSRTAARRSRR